MCLHTYFLLVVEGQFTLYPLIYQRLPFSVVFRYRFITFRTTITNLMFIFISIVLQRLSLSQNFFFSSFPPVVLIHRNLSSSYRASYPSTLILSPFPLSYPFDPLSLFLPFLPHYAPSSTPFPSSPIPPFPPLFPYVFIPFLILQFCLATH